MKIKILIAFALFDNLLISECMTGSMSQRYRDIRQFAEGLVESPVNRIARTKSKIITGLKAYSVVEPSQKETEEADEAMAYTYDLGCKTMPETMEKMNEFCDKRKERLNIIKNWITRQYTFNLLTRFFAMLTFTKISRKEDTYCSSEAYKQYYVQNALKLKELSDVLTTIKERFADQLIDIQNTNFGIGKKEELCCSYWTYRRDTLDAIKDIGNKLFVKDMIDEYFGLSVGHDLCFFIKENFCTGKELYNSPKAPNPYSFAMQLVRAVAKITSIAL